MGDPPVLSFNQWDRQSSDHEPRPLSVLKSPSTQLQENQLRNYILQTQRKIDKIDMEIQRTAESDDIKQLSSMLVKLGALMGLSLAQDAGDRQLLVKSLLQEDE
jgi:hypothetical protein